MSDDWIMVLNLTSTVSAAAAALLLYWAGVQRPWRETSWGGKTPRDIAEARRRVILKWIGVPCVLIAAVSQIVVIVFGR